MGSPKKNVLFQHNGGDVSILGCNKIIFIGILRVITHLKSQVGKVRVEDGRVR